MFSRVPTAAKCAVLCFVTSFFCWSQAQEQGATSSQEKIPETIQEISVSAQKKTQKAQSVPISMTVLNGTDLEELDLGRSDEISGQVPNLHIKQFTHAQPTIFIRGVGVNDFNVNANSAIGMYADEVYLSSPSGQSLQLFDMERIEVMRGPQGTLYGKNTTGGAVNFVSRKPTGGQGGYARLTLGRFDQVEFEGAVETAIVPEKAALRFAFVTRNRDGYLENLLNGNDENDRDNVAARLMLALTPNPDLDVLLKVNGLKNRSQATQAQRTPGQVDFLFYDETPDVHTGSWNLDGKDDIDSIGASLNIVRRSGNSSYHAITAYQTTERLLYEDGDASPNRVNELSWLSDVWQLSQEFRIQKSGDRLDWVAGLFYFTEELEVANRYELFQFLTDFGAVFNPMDPFGGPSVTSQTYEQETDSIAGFGQVDMRLSDSLTFTAGLRYTDEKKSIDLTSVIGDDNIVIPLINGFVHEINDEEVSGRLSLDYHPNDRLLLFANASRGFKSGGFNGGALLVEFQVSPVKPELMTALEVGLKSTSANRKLQFNATAFFYDYDDLQVFNVINLEQNAFLILDNAADARNFGLEAEMRVLPVQGLDFRFGLGLLDTEYKNYVQNDGTDLSGNQLPVAPDVMGNAAVTYWVPMNHGDMAFHLDLNYTDEYFNDSANNPQIASEAYWLVNARLAYESSNGRYGIALFGKNLTDEEYLVDGFDFTAFGYNFLIYGEPTTYGVELKYKF